MDTKCLDTLGWFIQKSEKDDWKLLYDGDLSKNVFGIIEYCNYKIYQFIPVLHGGQYVYSVVIKSK